MLGFGKYNYDRFTKEKLLRAVLHPSKPKPGLLGTPVLAGRFAGPRAGARAPGFSARTPEGAEIALRDFRGKKNVVLTLGSATSPSTAASIGGLNRLERAYSGDDVQFLFLYVREAHPGERLPSHRSPADKLRAAERFQAEEAVEMPVLVDDLRGSIHKKYGKLPNPTYLVDKSGRVAFRCLWTRPAVVERALQELRERQWERDVQHAVVQSGEYAEAPSASMLWRGYRALDRGGREAGRNFRREMGLSLGLTISAGRLLRPVLASPRRVLITLGISTGVAAAGILLGRYLLRERWGVAAAHTPGLVARFRQSERETGRPARHPESPDARRFAQS